MTVGRPAQAGLRTALIEAAAATLAREGAGALSARGLSRLVGTSTTAVYTRFGSMSELRRAVRREGFRRLGDHLAAVRSFRDPVAELGAIGAAYCANALANPNLYRAMFLDAPIDAEDATTGWETFDRLVGAVGRCIDEGRFPRIDDALWGATQLWTTAHGVIAVHLAGMLTVDRVMEMLPHIALSLYVGFGDEPEAAARSLSISGFADRHVGEHQRSGQGGPI